MFSTLVILATAALGAWAQINPTSPDGNTVVKVGGDIPAMWGEDTTGKWTNVEIQLMTGDNFNMVPLATLASNVDGTSTSSLNIPCPDVTPYSKIYFLQFTLGGDVTTATWTTRFTIAGADGSTVAPSETGTFNNVTVQWGTGALVGQAPAVISSGSATAITGAANSTSSNNSTSSSAGGGVIIATSVGAVTIPSSAATSTSGSSSASSSSSGTASVSLAPAAAKSSGSAIHGATVGLSAVIVGLAGLVAFSSR